MTTEFIPLLFIYNVEFFSSNYVGDAILLDQKRIVEFENSEWSAWVLGRGRRLTCKYFIQENFGSSRDEQGNIITVFLDARWHLSNSPTAVIHASENRLDLALDPSVAEVSSPFFFGPNQQAAPAEYNARIELSLQNMEQSADVQALVAYHRHQRVSPYTPSEVARFLKTARHLSPKSGNYLPACVDYEGKQIPCVIFLQEGKNAFFTQSRRRFHAQLYFSDHIAHLPAGTSFYRDVYWYEDGERKYIHTKVGTLLADIPANQPIHFR